jgi:hypothetical protein
MIAAPRSENGGHLDRHQNIRELDAELGDSASGRIGREEFGVFFIQAREVAGPRQEHQDLDHIGKRRSRRAENVLAVHQGLSRLLLDGRSRQLIGLRIDTDNARNIDGISRLDRLTEERGVGRVRRSNDLSRHLVASEQAKVVIILASRICVRFAEPSGLTVEP